MSIQTASMNYVREAQHVIRQHLSLNLKTTAGRRRPLRAFGDARRSRLRTEGIDCAYRAAVRSTAARNSDREVVVEGEEAATLESADIWRLVASLRVVQTFTSHDLTM